MFPFAALRKVFPLHCSHLDGLKVCDFRSSAVFVSLQADDGAAAADAGTHGAPLLQLRYNNLVHQRVFDPTTVRHIN